MRVLCFWSTLSLVTTVIAAGHSFFSFLDLEQRVAEVVVAQNDNLQHVVPLGWNLSAYAGSTPSAFCASSDTFVVFFAPFHVFVAVGNQTWHRFSVPALQLQTSSVCRISIALNQVFFGVMSEENATIFSVDLSSGNFRVVANISSPNFVGLDDLQVDEAAQTLLVARSTFMQQLPVRLIFVSLTSGVVLQQQDINSTAANIFVGIRGPLVLLGSSAARSMVVQPLPKFDPHAKANVPFYSGVWGLDSAAIVLYTLFEGEILAVDTSTFAVKALRKAMSDTACGGPWVLSTSVHAASNVESSILPGSVVVLGNAPLGDEFFNITFGSQLFGYLPGDSAVSIFTRATAIFGTSSTGLLSCAPIDKNIFLTRAHSVEGSFVSVLSLQDASIIYSYKLAPFNYPSHVNYAQSVAWVASRKVIVLLQVAQGSAQPVVELSVAASNFSVVFSVPEYIVGCALDKSESVLFAWGFTRFVVKTFIVGYSYPSGDRLNWSLTLDKAWSNDAYALAIDAKSNRFWVLTCTPFCSVVPKNVSLAQYIFTSNSVSLGLSVNLGNVEPTYLNYDAYSDQVVVISRDPQALFRVNASSMTVVSQTLLPYLKCGIGGSFVIPQELGREK
jgi:hypothetical protein